MEEKSGLKLDYNAPVILTFSLMAVGIHLLNFAIPNLTIQFFAVPGRIALTNPLSYFRLFSHVLGHINWGHLFGNITYILLLGPILEEKYGSIPLLIMIVFTALVTGILNVLFFSTGLLGASGIVFMLIILASIVDVKVGEIPLTFVLVAGIFIGTEILKALSADSISQMAHIVGGGVGALFGFIFTDTQKLQALTGDDSPPS
jgi:membrane associated rhomboid family serine protease